MHKFYFLEDMTQEDLNNLALERNNLQIENEQLKEQLKDENTYCEEANKWYKEAFQLQNNWNELKKWLQANDIHYAEAIPFKETLRKMQELEQGKDE